MCIFWQLGCCYFAEHNQFFFQFANEIVAWILLASERVPLDGVRFGSIPQSAQTFTQFLHIGQLTFLSTMEDICLYLSQGQDPTRLIALSNNKTNLAPFFFSIFCAVPVVFTLDGTMVLLLVRYLPCNPLYYTAVIRDLFCAVISGVNNRIHYQNV